MPRNAIVALVIVAMLSSTVMTGCTGGGLGGVLAAELGATALSLLGAVALDQFVGPLLGDPAGDLGSGGGSNNDGGDTTPPPDN